MTDLTGAAEPPGATYLKWLTEGELRLQWCTSCDRQIFYPRTLCPHCGDISLEWRRASGAGRVYSTTTVRQRPDRGGDYNVAIVELTEGARMLSRVEGVPPADVHIGMAVDAAIIRENDVPLIIFKAAEL
ncbi:Zn-ribbon domain-containing OB-fold protein [Sphingomonas crusticola]|uniref:Zn-ribbon domain-containing OB-fold protein n=1 Tax=Sphingomonas crusticola TaxID=1697973 RepID=UPI000E225F0E|nr:OB-fold domain-containing protein [Sphingomonas crusticola]